MNVYLDTCILIYLVESHERFESGVSQALRSVNPRRRCISDLVRLECLVVPLRNDDEDLIAQYNALFTDLRVVTMAPEVFDLAARLRANTTLRTPDALHAAAAIHHGCDELWTGDRRFGAIAERIVLRVFEEDLP